MSALPVMRKLEGRAAAAIAEAGAFIVVVTGDDEVRSWHRRAGSASSTSPTLRVSMLRLRRDGSSRWGVMVVHADLPPPAGGLSASIRPPSSHQTTNRTEKPRRNL
jgi:hypothetical protein